MQFHQYDPAKDTLKVGVTIRLGGREGVITGVGMSGHQFSVKWDENDSDVLLLKKFPRLGIGEELTITRRLKEEIKEEYMKSHSVTVDHEGKVIPENDLFIDWLDSLKEVD